MQRTARALTAALLVALAAPALAVDSGGPAANDQLSTARARIKEKN